jgi:putative transposase
MKQKRHSVDQVIAKLRRADVELGKGQKVPEVCKQLGITEQTYYRWRNQYSGMKAGEAKRLKELEEENNRLKKVVAESHSFHISALRRRCRACR